MLWFRENYVRYQYVLRQMGFLRDKRLFLPNVLIVLNLSLQKIIMQGFQTVRQFHELQKSPQIPTLLDVPKYNYS